MKAAPRSISVVVPVHDEQQILVQQVEGMVSGLEAIGLDYELILVENGSRDLTPVLCRQLAERLTGVRVLSVPTGDYGLALRHGILNAQHDIVVIFNVEFWSTEFIEIALAALPSRILVVGSKSAPGAHDERPWLRRAVTRGYNWMLSVIWGFDGTDTHGMKAFRRGDVVPLVKACRCTGFVFDTELVLRAQRARLSKLELPTDVREVRAPGLRSLARRVPGVLANLFRLFRSLAKNAE